MLKSKEISKHNPNVITNYKINSLVNSTIDLLELLEQVAKENELTLEELNELKVLVHKAYLKEKAYYFLDGKLNGLFDYLSDACNMALKSNSNINNNEYTEITYLNHTKKLLTNEYY